MNFTSPELVQEGLDVLSRIPVPACPGCKAGIRMCYHVPCTGTVDDIERLMDAGYAKNLMMDWWVGSNTAGAYINKDVKINNEFEENVQYLVPAIRGREGKKAPLNKKGICNLLIDDKCSVHHIKPIQGKIACCKMKPEITVEEDGQQVFHDERIPIIRTWNTQKGKDLIARWKKEVNFTLAKGEVEEFKIPVADGDIFAMLELMMEMLSSPEIPEHLRDDE